jgi:hypothetical protein
MEKFIPVVVIKDLSETDKILTALKNVGINCAEITFRTACAAEAIAYAVEHYPDMEIGAGTVINAAQCEAALAAGVTFIVSPGLSSAVAKTVIDRGYDVFYVTALSMISDFEYSRFGNDTGDETGFDTSRYFDCDLLIIDDLGTEVINKFTTSTLYNIINRRLTTGRSTIINTNLTQEEFRKQYWDRITSRVFGEYICLPFLGSDIRRQKIQK